MRFQLTCSRTLLLGFLVLSCSCESWSQATTGVPPFNSFGGGPDVINLSNLNAHLSIPILHKQGRMTDFGYNLAYDTSVWYPGVSGSTTAWVAVPEFGWTAETQASKGSGYITFTTGNIKCFQGQNWWIQGTSSNFKYWDPFGTGHSFSIPELGTCTGPSDGSATTNNGSGYTMYASVGSAYIVTPQGQTIYPPLNTPSGSANYTDRNGNQLTVSGNHFYDTLSSTVPVLTLSGAGTPTDPQKFTYTAPSGASAYYQVNYTNYTVHTNFGCTGISEYGPTTIALVSEIDLPDISVNPSDKYTFTYEPTTGYSGHVTGRLASVTLPTGGTLSYTYTGGNNGINCSDGSTAGLQRYTPDTGSSYWSYTRSGTGNARTTTISDPQGNVTVVQFQGLHETQRQFYQGAASPSNLLETITTCYNGNTSNCTGTAVSLPITQRNITTQLSGGQQSEHDDKWNIYGAPTETDDYDFGAPPHGALLKKITASYAALGPVTIFRQLVTTQDGNGNTVSQVQYNYDETNPVATSGTPQFTPVPRPWGNLTSTWTYTSSGTYLSKPSTYYDTGMVQTATDVNGGVKTYNYASGVASCYNSFATSINEAISGLSTSRVWNCTGGVATSTTDENSQTTTTTYTEPYFWRPASVTDPTNAVTSFCYGLVSSGTCTLNPNRSESTLTFNSGASTVDKLTTVDGLGRTHVQQTRQSPSSSNFDSVETDYDILGRVSRVTLPYSGTVGQTNSLIASTTTTYDAMNRPTSVTDGGGGITSYFYGSPGSQNNDVYVTRSPNPTGENTKRRQFEYDGLARLTSTCEVTASPGSGSCGQNTTQVGYWTKYGYDPMGNLKGLTQNAQMSGSTQTRSYVYDWMSRITSETVPEIGTNGNGTAYYTYDSDSTCGNSAGDLVKTVDAAGNVICSTYDLLHRRLTTTYPSGTYASVTPQKHFVYDSASVNNQTMAYPKARLAEAYTCFSPCSTKLTDTGFSYSVRGEEATAYESTPNSGTYYQTTQTYWANRAPNQLTGSIALPSTIAYTLDGEGRIYSVSASSGQSPLVSGTAYNSAGLPTAMNIGSGSGDTDAYTWDPNTNRMTQYQFTVNGTSLTGALGWNANSTLQTQNITNGFNSAGTQNCTYGYDDLTRVTTANCGSAASQTFSYDPFGNLDKSGSPNSFQPFYSSSTNRITTVGGFTVQYDSNGNVLNDNFHSYTWDADGHAITVDAGQSDAVSLAYDALGRMVEQTRGNAHTQIVYSPLGQKLALMSGTTLQKAMVPLSGKAFALYNSSGLLYYAHPDYLGNIRLASTPSRGKYFDAAYAPFGETYTSSGTLDPAYTGQMDDTGHRQDTAGGLYDFPAREYSTQGRWPNPDPLGRAAACPKDPQTQNRYVYVRNNPVTHTDPTGLMECEQCGEGGGGGGCSPDDPYCIMCDPDDPLCGYTGGGPGFIGDGGNPEKPRPFPWLLLPALFFESPGTPAPDCSKGTCKPPCGKFFMQNLCNPGDILVERWICPEGCSLDDCKSAATEYSLQWGKKGDAFYATCSRFQGFGQVAWCDGCKKSK
jgi:RHS repeat-associated protein